MTTASTIPPPPIWAPQDSSEWLFWFQNLANLVATTATFNTFLQNLQNGNQALKLPASTATTAPLLFAVGGVLVTTPTTGMLEFDADHVYYTTASGGRVIIGSPTSFGNPMTTLGDLITGGASGSPQRLPAGVDGEVLEVVGGVPAWAAKDGHTNAITSVPVANVSTTYTYTNAASYAIDLIITALSSSGTATYAVFTTASFTRGATTVAVPIFDKAATAGNFSQVQITLSPGDSVNLVGVTDVGTPGATIEVIPR